MLQTTIGEMQKAVVAGVVVAVVGVGVVAFYAVGLKGELAAVRTDNVALGQRIDIVRDELKLMTTPPEHASDGASGWWCGVSSCTRYEESCNIVDRDINARAGLKCRKSRVAWCSILKIATHEGVRPTCFNSELGCRIDDSHGGETCLGVE